MAHAGSSPLEVLAGMAESLAGMAIVGRCAECGLVDLGCVIGAVGAGGALGAVAGVGLGVHWLLNRGSDRNVGDTVVIPIFAVAQGIGAALGSRALGR